MQTTMVEPTAFALPPDMNSLLADHDAIRFHANRIRANGFGY